MVRASSLILVVLAVCACLSLAMAGPPQPPVLPVAEQNLDEQGNIRVHEQGTVSVEGTVTVNDLASALAKLDAVLTQLQQTLSVQGSINVANLPAVQEVSGTVAVSNLPASNQVEVVGPIDERGNIRVSRRKLSDTVFLGTVRVPGGGTVYEYPAVEVSGAERVAVWYRGDRAETRSLVEAHWEIAPGEQTHVWPAVGGPMGWAWSILLINESVADLGYHGTVVGPRMVVRVHNWSPDDLTVSTYAYITY